MRLLILGSGRMAGAHAEAFSQISGVDIVGCVDLDGARAAKFANEHNVPVSFENFDAALSGVDFDAVTNCTPDAAHFATTMAVLNAGKHVLCEKPLATSYAHAQEMTEAAEAAGVVNGVNLTYRNVAALQKARAVVESGALGALKHFEASYKQSWLAQPAWGDWRTHSEWLWRLSTKHGSLGVAGDIGIHIFDFLTFVAGEELAEIAPVRARFDKAPPNETIGDYHLDANDSVTMTAVLSGGAHGVISATRYATGHLNDLSLQLFGDKGALRITNAGNFGSFEMCSGDDRETATWRKSRLGPVATNYEKFARAVDDGLAMTPDFRVATGLQRFVDQAAGVA